MNYYTCDKCNGTGFASTDEGKSVSICPKCDGEKKLDWIDNILGKRNKKEIKTAPGVYVKEMDLSEMVPSFPEYGYVFECKEDLRSGDVVAIQGDGSITKCVKNNSKIIGIVKSYNFARKQAIVQINGVT